MALGNSGQTFSEEAFAQSNLTPRGSAMKRRRASDMLVRKFMAVKLDIDVQITFESGFIEGHAKAGKNTSKLAAHSRRRQRFFHVLPHQINWQRLQNARGRGVVWP